MRLSFNLTSNLRVIIAKLIEERPTRTNWKKLCYAGTVRWERDEAALNAWWFCWASTNKAALDLAPMPKLVHTYSLIRLTWVDDDVRRGRQLCIKRLTEATTDFWLGVHYWHCCSSIIMPAWKLVNSWSREEFYRKLATVWVAWFWPNEGCAPSEVTILSEQMKRNPSWKPAERLLLAAFVLGIFCRWC